MRKDAFSNRVFSSQDQILVTCCEVWIKLTQELGNIMSTGTKDWLRGF
jgi:hypothetical protein